MTGAGPIFHAIMLAAASRANGPLPDPLVSATAATPQRTTRRVVCALSGHIATPACPRQVEEWLADESDADFCEWHRATPRGVVVRWPSAYREWAASHHLLSLVVATPRPVSDPRHSSSSARSAPVERTKSSIGGLRVLSPPDGAVYLIDPTLRREFQTIGLRGATDDATTLEWRVDETPVGTTAPDTSLNWPLMPGRHVITAQDAQGRSASASIFVK